MMSSCARDEMKYVCLTEIAVAYVVGTDHVKNKIEIQYVQQYSVFVTPFP